MRVFVAVLAAVAGMALAGCQSVIDGHPVGAPGSSVSGGSGLRFRQVLDFVPAGGPDGQLTARQPTDPVGQNAGLRALDCAQLDPDPLAGKDDPALPLLACGQDGRRYLLGPSFLDGSDLASVSAGRAPDHPAPVITLTFGATGTRVLADWTSHHLGWEVALVLDARVLSAPRIQSAILGGNTQISGKFTDAEAEQLAQRIAGR